MTAPGRSQRPIDVLRSLPANIEAEKSFLGSVFLDNGVLDREILTPEDFRLESHRRIYMAILELWEGRIPIDPVILSDLLDKKDWSRHTGGFEYLDELSIIVPTAANASHYARILMEQTALRKAKILNAQHAQAIEEGDLEKVERLQGKLAESLCLKEPVGGMDWAKYRLDIAKSATIKPPPQKFVVGHLPEEPGNYGAIIGPDGVRKSWLALHIALAVAGGRPVAQGPDGSCLWPAPQAGRVVYITSEDSPDVMWRRVWNISQMPGYSWASDMEKNLDILPVFSSLTLLSTAQDGSIVQTPEYRQLIEYAQGARLIILDPLADVFDLDENGNREGRAIVQALRQISLRTGAGVLGVHHQNKASMLSGEKNHQSGRGSSKFGAGCRWAVVLQPLSQALGEDWLEAEGVGEEEAKDWTSVHESKASYAEEYAGDAFFKKVAVVDDDGKLFAAAPLAMKLTDINLKPGKKQKEKKESGYATAY